MPSSMTHTYFGIDVYNNLNKNCQNKIKNKLEYLKLFSQGSDIFMFYHFLLGKKSIKYKKIQLTMHNEKTGEFFINTIKSIHKNNFINNEECIAYLYGYICHYILDYYTHPFIYYHSGIFKKNDKDSYKYNGIHQELEYLIDCYLIEKKENISPIKYKVYKNIFNVNKFNNELKIVLEESITKTYNYQNITKKYLICIKYMKKFFKYFNYDPYGIKYYLYKTIDSITPKSTINFKELSYYNYKKSTIEYLNITNNKWTLPWNNTSIHTESFIDLYNNAKKEAIRIIEEVINIIETETLDIKKLELLFPNISFTTGLSCNKKVKMKYFSF